MNGVDPSATAPKRFYRVREICHMTGLSKAKVFQALKAGKIQGLKLEGTLLIPADSFHRYLDNAVPWKAKDSDDERCERR